MEFIFSSLKHLVVETLIPISPTFQTLQYYLVKHPRVHNFEWHQGQTFGSSITFLTLTILLYLTLAFLLSRRHTTTSPSTTATVPPLLLRLLTAAHNAFLLSLSAAMAAGCGLSILTVLPDVDHLICFPPNTRPKGPLFFWTNVYYLSKIYEYVDTLLIALSSSASRRLSFLHVYHHASVVFMCYVSLHTAQSMYPAVVVANSAVHVIMYLYYLMCSLGKRPTWKKVVTDTQIVQFYSGYGIMALIFYRHFTGPGCSGVLGWCFDAVFISSLLYLFLDFHAKTYGAGMAAKKVNGDGVDDFAANKPLKQA
ncbi:unnamed protein product [Linum trigynum]|uniref:Very-long-chain 3-oxoacyl-CoA synthase n=1 Tax=Linum trigynum TaxID=586398 RepID=A0AAV2C8N8_9ROSI